MERSIPREKDRASKREGARERARESGEREMKR